MCPSNLNNSLDLNQLLAGWQFQPGRINARKIRGDDGGPKLQLRLDLGLLQMETTGRPDGRRPHGAESLMAFHAERLRAHRASDGTDIGFELGPEECRALRDEAQQYYYRYLCCFVLCEWEAVARDTRRNLALIELLRCHAATEHDRSSLDAYLPYTVMMQSRAAASLKVQAGELAEALRVVASAQRRIRRHYRRCGGRAAYETSAEVKALKRMARQIRRRLPQSPARRLQRNLRNALAAEQYERAAALRDRLASLPVEPLPV